MGGVNKVFVGARKRDFIEWGMFIMAFGLILPLSQSKYMVYLSTEIMIWGFFAVAFNLLFGVTGLLSFGQAAFFGLGAYSYTLLMMNARFPFIVCVILALAIPPLFAFLMGPLCVRLREVFFSLMTMAFAQLIWAVTFKWYSFTGGDNGIQDIPAPAFFGSPLTTYYVVFFVILGCLVLCWLIRNSAFGCILATIRENPKRTPFIGINVRRYQLAVFVIAGFFSGVAGLLFALFQRSIHPQLMHWTTSGDIVLMTVLGGFPTFFGSILGAVIIVLIKDFISAYTEYWSVFVGLIILFCVVMFPRGILGSLHTFLEDKLSTRE
jgi:branched-chain amino acid transport system permease protein